jgi:hypothetical protein
MEKTWQRPATTMPHPTPRQNCFTPKLSKLATNDRLIAKFRNTNTNTNTNMDLPIMNTNYCWYDGTLVSRNHNSQNCRFPKDGHKTEATREKKIRAGDA